MALVKGEDPNFINQFLLALRKVEEERSKSMDELTKHILEVQKEQEEHPERFQINIICDSCHKSHVDWFQKVEVEQCIKKHGKAEIHTWECEKCSKDDKEDDG